MSNYSHALSNIIDEGFDGKQSRLAEQCSVPQSLVSRHLTGEFRPDLESLEKICTAIPKEMAVQLTVAHLRDETPASIQPHIEIRARLEPATLQETPPPYHTLDRKTKAAIDYMATCAMQSKEARDMLQSTAKLLGCEL